MRWELHNGEKQVGPLEENEIAEAIRGGRVPDTVVIRAEGTEEWKPLRSHAPFALVLGASPPVPVAQPTATLRSSPAWHRYAIYAGSVVALVAALAIFIGARHSGPAASADPVVVRATEALPPASNKTEEQLPSESVLKAKTFAAAVAAAKPMMHDVRESTSDGERFLAWWGAAHGRWDDVAIKRDETTFGRVKKDSDEERGKRYCASGSLIQIEIAKTDAGKFGIGLLMDDSANLWHFVAFGSTGRLVERSPARICGVVVGNYDYANSGGGQGHAVSLVGMFDLPENRKP